MMKTPRNLNKSSIWGGGLAANAVKFILGDNI